MPENKGPKGIDWMELEQRVGVGLGMYRAFKMNRNLMPLSCQGRKFLPNWKGWLLECWNPWGAFLEGLEEARLWESSFGHPHPAAAWLGEWVKYTSGARAARWVWPSRGIISEWDSILAGSFLCQGTLGPAGQRWLNWTASVEPALEPEPESI